MAITRVEDLLRTRAQVGPDVVALVVDDGPELTFADWDRRAGAMAAVLHSKLAGSGMAPCQAMALYFDNRDWTEYAVAYLAVLQIGAIAVPLSPRFSPDELNKIYAHAQITCGISAAGFPSEATPMAAWTVQDLESVSAPAVGGVEVDEAALAEIIYTSGTTGEPKGVACTHASILIHDLPPEAPTTTVRFAHAFPIGTNAGQECVRMPLRRGAQALVLPRFDPERLCAAVARHRINRLQLVPAMAELILATAAMTRHDVSSVDRITLSSAPAAPSLLARLALAFPHVQLCNAYALTESGSARTVMAYDPARPTAVGRAVGSSQIRVVDEQEVEVAPATVGEIWLRREGAPRREYYRDPVATAAAFRGDWLRTGDLGYLDDEGYLFLVDRKKDLIISGGLNISTLEIEEVLLAHPQVQQAAVFALPHQVMGQVVAAALVARVPPDVRAVQALIRDRLGEHKVPKHVFFVDTLPRTAAGKVRKQELRDRFAEVLAAPKAPSASAINAVEQSIAAIFAEVLRVAAVGREDDFFALGGHSLGATQVTSRVAEAFGIDLPVTAVFEYPTVAELGEAVSAAIGQSR